MAGDPELVKRELAKRHDALVALVRKRLLESWASTCTQKNAEHDVSAFSMVTKQGIFQGSKSLVTPQEVLNMALGLINFSSAKIKQHGYLVDDVEPELFPFPAQKNARYGTQVPDYSNAATQHSNSGGAVLPCIYIDMTGVLPHQGGADDSSLNHQAHAQAADNNDGPPPVRININNQADETTGDLTKMANWLFGMGLGTLIMSVATALYKAPRGLIFERYKPAYYGTLAVISVCGMAEVAVAFCVSRCRRFVRVVLCASVAPFATIVALGGFSVLVKG